MKGLAALLIFPCLLSADGRYNKIAPLYSLLNNQNVVNSTGMLLNDAGKKIAYKFYPVSTAAIDSADLFLWVPAGASMAGVTLKLRIETDGSDVPSGSVLGAASAAFAAPATANAGSWTGMNNLGANTGALALNTPYWLVLYDGGGTGPTTANYVQARNFQLQLAGDRIRGYNGADWTTVSAVSAPGIMVLHHTDGAYTGVPLTSGTGVTSKTAVYGSNQLGWRFKSKVTLKVSSIQLYIRKNGTPPGNLEVTLYEGSSSKVTATIPGTNIVSGTVMTIRFAEQTLQANTDCYVVLHQAGGAGTSGNSYSLYTIPLNFAYVSAAAPDDFRMVYGTGSDPAALAVDNSTELVSGSAVNVVIANDLVGGGSGGGGGAYVFAQ